MPTLYEYFKTDFAKAFAQTTTWETSSITPGVKVTVNVGLDLYSNAKFLVYYVPEFSPLIDLLRGLITQASDIVSDSNGVVITPVSEGEYNIGSISSDRSVFSNRIYFYLENDLTPDQCRVLEDFIRTKSVVVTIRGKDYVMSKMAVERPLAFISHDSGDKADVAFPIAMGLTKLMCPVWYDDFSLKIGDHLRESIEKGLKEAHKCILVLSPKFLSNTGWTKTEFNSIFTRELLSRSSVILPVWFGVPATDVYDYSPSLANKMGLDWTKLGEDEVVRRLYHAIKG